MISCPDFFWGVNLKEDCFCGVFFVKTNVFLVCSSGVERKVRDFFLRMCRWGGRMGNLSFDW